MNRPNYILASSGEGLHLEYFQTREEAEKEMMQQLMNVTGLTPEEIKNYPDDREVSYTPGYSHCYDNKTYISYEWLIEQI